MRELRADTALETLEAGGVAYERGNYEIAARLFRKATRENPELADSVESYLELCDRVAAVALNAQDQLRLDSRRVRRSLRWLWLPLVVLAFPVVVATGEDGSWRDISLIGYLGIGLAMVIALVMFRVFTDFPRGDFRRCKHCGHYTPYIPPNEGWGWMGHNNCSVCDRMYPMPTLYWDSRKGQAEMAERYGLSKHAAT